MKKKAVILLITIGFIALMSVFILTSISIFENSLKNISQIERIERFNVLFSDIVAILNKKVKLIKDSLDLDMFLGVYPPFVDPKGKVSMQIVMEPKVNRININNLLYKRKVDFVTKAFLQKVLLRYEVSDEDYFIRLLLDTLDYDESERGANTEIVLKESSFINGKIENKKHFDKILDYYVSVTNDENIKKIPWDKLIFFGDRDKKYILDCDRMYPELVEVLFGMKTAVNCKDIKNMGISAFNYSSYKKGVDYPIECRVAFKIDGKIEKVKFDYNLKTHKVSNIEKYF